MKKIFFSLMAASSICSAVMAQETSKMYVWQKNGNLVEYEIANVDSITFQKYEKANEESTEIDASKTMQQLRTDLVETAPYIANNSYGTVTHYTYYSSTINKDKPVNVLLPPNYDKSKKYPVLFVLHGIGGNENNMVNGMGVQEVIADAVSNRGVKDMIVIFPQMFTSATKSGWDNQFNMENTRAYDNFINDIVDDLIPWVKKNYSVAEGRENMAITGFSMGGREALYIGTQRTNIFGYIGAACPAPGILPTTDMAMKHDGTFTNEADFKIKDGNPNPYILLISGGTNDGVVGNYPEQYHNILTRNNVDHVWHSINGTGHDANSVIPHLYNFIGHIFPASK